MKLDKRLVDGSIFDDLPYPVGPSREWLELTKCLCVVALGFYSAYLSLSRN